MKSRRFNFTNRVMAISECVCVCAHARCVRTLGNTKNYRGNMRHVLIILLLLNS